LNGLLRDRDTEIQRLQNELNLRLKDIDDWKSKYAALESQFNAFRSSNSGDLDRLNGLLRDRQSEIDRLKDELQRKTRDYDDLLTRFNAL
jgi:predicted RNase H-like nuclease (RuvC/YqgF family)